MSAMVRLTPPDQEILVATQVAQIRDFVEGSEEGLERPIAQGRVQCLRWPEAAAYP